ncbi:hypothetical protein K440DRAFT_620200, partial [Wilcoxina mikolae CBS 423.85]
MKPSLTTPLTSQPPWESKDRDQACVLQMSKIPIRLGLINGKQLIFTFSFTWVLLLYVEAV